MKFASPKKLGYFSYLLIWVFLLLTYILGRSFPQISVFWVITVKAGTILTISPLPT
jgi:hypothetical protein